MKNDRRTAADLSGVVSLMLTPFNAQGGIDWQVYADYVRWQVGFQPAALFTVCGSSEMKWLTRDERLKLTAETVKHANGVPVIATANLDPDLSQHRTEMQQIIDAGATAVVLVPPPQISDQPQQYLDYLLTLNDAASCPVLVYEWPQVPNHLMEIAVFEQLAQRGTIAGIKDTTCTVEGISAKQQRAGDVVVYQANTPYMLDALDLGVKGIMAVTSTARADLVCALWQAHQTGSPERDDIHRQLVYLDAILRGAYPATAKYLVSLQGVDMPLHTRWDVTLTSELKKALDIWQHHTPIQQAYLSGESSND